MRQPYAASSVAGIISARSPAITLGSAVALEGDPRPPTLVATPIDEPLLNERLLQVTVMRERRLAPAVDQFLSTLTNALRESLGAPPATREEKKTLGGHCVATHHVVPAASQKPPLKSSSARLRVGACTLCAPLWMARS